MTSPHQELLEQLDRAQKSLDPQLKLLRNATAALQQASKAAKDEHLDALAMQKVLDKLQQVNSLLESEHLQSATSTFAQTTQAALDALAFEFAGNLKESFSQRGQNMGGRPPTLVVEPLVLQINIGARKAQWFYGKEALARPLSLSIATIMQVYDQQNKAIAGRTLDIPAFVAELYQAWNKIMTERKPTPAGGRVNLVELYSQVVLNRQSARFWNAPSRSTFKDYERVFFVRDLTMAHSAPTVQVDGQQYQLRLGGATKNQADSASRSIWLPQSALEGEYYASLTFERADSRVPQAVDPEKAAQEKDNEE